MVTSARAGGARLGRLRHLGLVRAGRACRGAWGGGGSAEGREGIGGCVHDGDCDCDCRGEDRIPRVG